MKVKDSLTSRVVYICLDCDGKFRKDNYRESLATANNEQAVCPYCRSWNCMPEPSEKDDPQWWYQIKRYEEIIYTATMKLNLNGLAGVNEQGRKYLLQIKKVAENRLRILQKMQEIQEEIDLGFDISKAEENFYDRILKMENHGCSK